MYYIIEYGFTRLKKQRRNREKSFWIKQN